MSLFSAFIRDSWQQTVIRSDVYFSIREDLAPGSGTLWDPYHAGGYVGDSSGPTRFDFLMAGLPKGTAVRLGPTPTAPTGGSLSDNERFLTRGFNVTDGVVGGWKPVSGMRIVGAGMNNTTVRLVGHPNDKLIVALGNKQGTDFLDGFEASDFTIDCNITAGQDLSQVGGGAALTGAHVHLRQLRVVNFGSDSTTAPCLVLSTGRWAWGSPSLPIDCVIDNCMVESPFVSAKSSTVTCLHLGGEPAGGGNPDSWHRACVIRNCYVDCGAANLAKDFRGIAVYGGEGSIVEGNQILNCQRGGPYRAEADSGLLNKDLIVRDNYLYNVVVGPKQVMPIDVQAGRLFVHDNVIELAESGAGGESNPTAIQLDIQSGTSKRFQSFIARWNVIRVKDNSATAATRYGIVFESCEETVVEENVIDLGKQTGSVGNPPDNAVRFKGASCGTVKAFNNQTSDGQLLRAYDEDAGNEDKHVWELIDEGENAMLGL